MAETRNSSKVLTLSPPMPSVSDGGAGEETSGGPLATEPERVICVRELLGRDRAVVLIHAGQRYRLSLTSKDRLILTK